MIYERVLDLSTVTSVLIGSHWIDVALGSGGMALCCRLDEGNGHTLSLGDNEEDAAHAVLHFRVANSQRELTVRLSEVRALMTLSETESASSYGE